MKGDLFAVYSLSLQESTREAKRATERCKQSAMIGRLEDEDHLEEI
jgi:hypothetical protein